MITTEEHVELKVRDSKIFTVGKGGDSMVVGEVRGKEGKEILNYFLKVAKESKSKVNFLCKCV